MDQAERSRVKARKVLLGAAGLMLAPLIGAGLKALGIAHFSYASLLLGAGTTFFVQGLVWLVPALGGDRHLTWDPHYIYLPTLVAGALLCLDIYFAPEARVLVLMVWFVVLLFMAGLAGFLEVVLLSGAVTLGYISLVRLLARRGELASTALDSVLAGIFFLVCVYAGAVFERLRRDRREMRELRRVLAEIALTDSLTGLPNRRCFEENARAELARSRRTNAPCALAMVDVDFFKNHNDTLGHVSGDEILRQLATVLSAQLRAGDVAARYGGDEFALVLADTARREAHQVLERLRAAVETHPFLQAQLQTGGRVTISAGIAVVPEDGLDYEGLVLRADAALYTAKSSGRNRVHAPD